MQSKKERHTGELFQQVQPHDLLKFGIIPELVGRMPVITALQGLTREDLVRILTEPKNALVKQYQKLLSYDGVELHFDQDALEAVADTALARNIGARGLRAVMEGLLTKVMYDVPSDPTITDVTITKACVDGDAEPTVLHDPERWRSALNSRPARRRRPPPPRRLNRGSDCRKGAFPAVRYYPFSNARRPAEKGGNYGNDHPEHSGAGTARLDGFPRADGVL